MLLVSNHWIRMQIYPSFDPQSAETKKGAFRVGTLSHLMLNFMQSLDLLIFGKVPPDIVDYETSHDTAVDEGQNVNFTCSANGLPEPTIEWRREGKKPLVSFGNDESKCWPSNDLTSHLILELSCIVDRGVATKCTQMPHLAFHVSVYTIKGPTLMLRQANRNHMGAYLCIASNGVPPSVSKRIILVVNCTLLSTWCQTGN